MLLEAKKHEANSFVTLTYSEDHEPADRSVSVRDLQLFCKRLRRRVGKFRYFAVGEYGDTTQRPHYHLACFGASDAVAVDESWGRGFTYTGDLTPQSVAYIAGYVTKKMTHADDPRLEGRAPEFARMSLRPGIGAPAVENLAAGYLSRRGARVLSRDLDVVGVFRAEGTFPLGRYLKGKLRESVGMDQTSGREVYRMAQRARRDQLVDPAVRELEEGKRLQDRHRARWRESFNRSTKGRI